MRIWLWKEEIILNDSRRMNTKAGNRPRRSFQVVNPERFLIRVVHFYCLWNECKGTRNSCLTIIVHALRVAQNQCIELVSSCWCTKSLQVQWSNLNQLMKFRSLFKTFLSSLFIWFVMGMKAFVGALRMRDTTDPYLRMRMAPTHAYAHASGTIP